MDLLTIAKETCWEKPDYYFGFNPVGDTVVLTLHRESPIMDKSNWQVAEDSLLPLNEVYPAHENNYIESGDEDFVYIFRASHCLVGWVDYLMIRKDSPEDVLIKAGEIISSISDYPCLDDEHYSQLQHDEVWEYWENCSLSEKIGYAAENECSIFSIRRDMPESVYDHLLDTIY